MSQGMHYSFISYSSHAIFVEVSSFSFPSFWPFYHLLAVPGLQQRTRVLRCSPTACTWLVPVPGGGRIRKQDVRSKKTTGKDCLPHQNSSDNATQDSGGCQATFKERRRKNLPRHWGQAAGVVTADLVCQIAVFEESWQQRQKEVEPTPTPQQGLESLTHS